MKLCPECKNAFDTSGWVCPVCAFRPKFDGKTPLFAPSLADENDGFSGDYFDELAGLEAKNFWFRARNKLILQALHKHCPDMRTFMEIGCGTGFVLSGVVAEFPRVEAAGMEIFSKGLIHASRRVPGAEFIQADARHLPFEAHFNAIGAFDVLEHIEDDERVLTQIYQALVPGGTVILTVPQHSWLWSRQDELAHHARRYNAADLQKKVETAGFSVSHSRSFVSLLLPLMWLSRHQISSAQRADALIELRIGALTNFVLTSVMRIEALLTRIGIRFPAGGSLLLVARKPSP